MLPRSVAATLVDGGRSVGAAITVGDALRLPCLSTATVLAGAAGLERRIEAVNVLEDIDIVRWMRGGELLLTTGYSVRQDPRVLRSLVPALAERRLAGLVIKLGLYIDELPAEVGALADELAFPVIGMPAPVMFHDVFSEVLGTILNRHALELERSHAIHEKLTHVALEGGSYRELADALAQLLERPVGIFDAHGTALATTADAPAGEPDAARAARPIRTGRQTHGEVVVWAPEERLEPHELTAMEHAATVAATSIAQERAIASSEQRHRTLLFMQLVIQRTADRDEIGRWATAMGWDMDLERAVVLVEAGDADGPRPVGGQPLADDLTSAIHAILGARAIVCDLGSCLAVLVEPRPSLRDRCHHLHAALHERMPGMEVRVAAGTLAAEFRALSESWQAAVATLTLGRELSGDDFVLEHSELGVYRLLSRLPSGELERHRAEMLGPLLAHDRTHAGCLLQTLEVFLRCDGNRVAAARQLYVHYNTLRYRLTQIERLVGGLGAEPNRRLNLQLALCAHRLLQGRGDG
jgi:purine catabolism regulator